MSNFSSQFSKAEEPGFQKLFIRDEMIPSPNDPEAFQRFCDERQKGRAPYFQLKEVWEREVAETATVKKMVNLEFRDRCRIQIDEYMDCMSGKATGWTCRPEIARMQKCLTKQLETGDYERRQKELLEQRRLDGTSSVNHINLSKHNRFVENIPEKVQPRAHEVVSVPAAAESNPVPIVDGSYSKQAEEWKREFHRIKKAPSESDRFFE